MDPSSLAEVTAWLFPAVSLAGAIAVFIKLGARAAGILGGIGLLLLALVQLLWTLLWRQQIAPDWTYEMGSWLYEIGFPTWGPWVRLVSYGLLIAGFLTVPRRGTAAAAPASFPGAASGAAGSVPPPHRFPGWGAATGWIVTSSLSTVSGLVCLAVVLEAGRTISSSEEEWIFAFLALTVLLLIPALILFCVWLYQSWDSVPPAHRSTTPGKAVGLLFVPLFNLYWIFRALPGLSGSIARAHRAVDRNTIGSPGYGLGIAVCIVALIPYLDTIAWLLALIWVCITNAARNRMLLAYRQDPARAAEAPPAM